MNNVGVPTEDEAVFGKSMIVYCQAHRRAHATGWCTVPCSEKIALVAQDNFSAKEECKAKGLPIDGE